jgi:hypothetical protein
VFDNEYVSEPVSVLLYYPVSKISPMLFGRDTKRARGRPAKMALHLIYHM